MPNIKSHYNYLNSINSNNQLKQKRQHFQLNNFYKSEKEKQTGY